MDSYKVDNSLKHIKLAVLVGTTGSAKTKTYLNFTTKNNLLFESDDNSNGNIPETFIGRNRDLVLETLIIVTILNFSNVPPSQRANAIAMTHILYSLSGGVDGDKVYDNKNAVLDDTNEKRVIITKKIEFV